MCDVTAWAGMRYVWLKVERTRVPTGLNRKFEVTTCLQQGTGSNTFKVWARKQDVHVSTWLHLSASLGDRDVFASKVRAHVSPELKPGWSRRAKLEIRTCFLQGMSRLTMRLSREHVSSPQRKPGWSTRVPIESSRSPRASPASAASNTPWR